MKTQKVRIEMTAKLPITLKKKAKTYVSCCPLLDVYSQGKTKKEAEKNLVEALSLFFISCFERGTLDDVLKECGFEPLMPSQDQLYGTLKSGRYIDVPIPFQAPKFRQATCHV
jgi:predicted RNase H-like HicB family nuclease